MIHYAPEVLEARAFGRPVVALESTILAHGLPYPDNLELGRAIEQAVRDAGAAPATIAVVDGKPWVGLDDATLTRLCEHGDQFGKTGATDLAVVLGRGGSAATTVSATLAIAARADIRLFATGGIGGVHRGDAGDVSHDLLALAREPVCVVSAGAKAILDLPRTLERLETLGVPVVGYQTDVFPAFYSRDSGLPLEHRADQPDQIARILKARWDDLGQGGLLVANPVPEADAVPVDRAEDWIASGLAMIEERGITGKAVTPALLAHIAEVSEGQAVAANKALALANARLAAAVAVAYRSL